CHLPAASFVNSSGSAPFFLISIFEMSLSFSVRIFGAGASTVEDADVVESLAGWRSDQYRTPVRASKTAAATSIPVVFIEVVLPWPAARALSAPPPDGHAGENYGERKNKLAGDAHIVELRLGHGDAAIVLFFGTNGDEILVRGEPVHGVESEVAIAVEADEGVRKPVGTADDHEAALGIFLAGGVGTGSGQGQRAFLVFWIVGINRRRIEFFSGQAGIGRAEQLGH